MYFPAGLFHLAPEHLYFKPLLLLQPDKKGVKRQEENYSLRMA